MAAHVDCSVRAIVPVVCLFALAFNIGMGQPARPYPPHAAPRLEGETTKGLPAVTGRVCVDQFGYLPQGQKVAVISDPQKGYNAGDLAPAARVYGQLGDQ